MMKFSIVVFPGSNCDHDAYHAAKHVLGQEAEFVWHKETSLQGADVVVLPGGFSHGDYLRTGAIARFSPVMSRGRRVCARRRPRARHLQRLSDSLRSGSAAGCDAAQSRLEVPLRARLDPRGTDGHAVHVACGRAGACGFRSRTAKGTTLPSPMLSPSLNRRGASSSAIATRAARLPTRPTRTVP